MPLSNDIIQSADYGKMSHAVPEEGSAAFDAYMYSKAGLGNDSNSDNYYMNGIFMDNFKFTNLKKVISVSGTNAVFAVSNGVSSDRASKIVFRYLLQKKEEFDNIKSVDTAKEVLQQAIEFCNKGLFEEGNIFGEKYTASLAIVVYYKNNIICASHGDGLILLKSKGKLKDITPSGTLLGTETTIGVTVGKYKLQSGDELVLCTDGIKKTLTFDEISDTVVPTEDAYDIAVKLVEKASAAEYIDTTCMVVKTAFKNELKISTIMVAVACMIVTLLELIYIINVG